MVNLSTASTIPIQILNGKLAMIDTEDGAKYAVIERVTWEVK